MNAAELKFRKLNAEDVESFKALTNLFIEVFEEPRNILSDNNLANVLENPLFHAFVAESEGTIIGGCAIYELTKYYAEKAEWFIYDVAVRTEFQNRGIGKQLISFVKQDATDNGAGCVFVLAHSEDVQAVKFYHSVHGTAEKVDLFEFDV